MGGSSTRWIPAYLTLLDPKHEMHPHSTGQPACDAFAWLDMIGMARWKDGGGLKRGQLRASVRFLAARWNWSKNRAAQFLSYLEEDGMIRRVPPMGRKPGHITICNYERYAIGRDANRDANLYAKVDKEVEVELEERSKPLDLDSSTEVHRARESKSEERGGEREGPEAFDATVATLVETMDAKPRPKIADIEDELREIRKRHLHEESIDHQTEVVKFLLPLFANGSSMGGIPPGVRVWMGRIPAARIMARIQDVETGTYKRDGIEVRWPDLTKDEKKRIVTAAMNELLELLRT